MEARIVDRSRKIATLNAKTSPWLGWELLFENNLSPGRINDFIPLIEVVLNRYLERNVDVAANRLVIPFNCKLVSVAGNQRLYQFRVNVVKRVWFLRLPFNYPHGPILSMDDYTIIIPPHVESQTTSVALKRPAL